MLTILFQAINWLKAIGKVNITLEQTVKVQRGSSGIAVSLFWIRLGGKGHAPLF